MLRRTLCAPARTVELIGRHWTDDPVGLVLACSRGRARHLRHQRYGLSERLRELEVEGVVTRSWIREKTVRLEYALTAKGRPLERAIVAIAGWAERRVALPRTAWETETTQS